MIKSNLRLLVRRRTPTKEVESSLFLCLSCAGDEGQGPFEVGFQEQASNHLKLLWPKAMVVSVEEKSGIKLGR
jgi:hypothetical protein